MSTKVLFVEGIGEVQLVRKSSLKRLRISVKSTGEVLVSIPWLFSFSRGEVFLEEKRKWVIKTQQKLQKHGLTRKLLEPGLLFSTRNFNYHLSHGKNEKVKVQLRHEQRIA